MCKLAWTNPKSFLNRNYPRRFSKNSGFIWDLVIYDDLLCVWLQQTSVHDTEWVGILPPMLLCTFAVCMEFAPGLLLTTFFPVITFIWVDRNIFKVIPNSSVWRCITYQQSEFSIQVYLVLILVIFWWIKLLEINTQYCSNWFKHTQYSYQSLVADGIHMSIQ